jgi:hypothetical protein
MNINIRIVQIARCMEELAKCRYDFKIAPCGAQLGELDWLDELHHLVHSAA